MPRRPESQYRGFLKHLKKVASTGRLTETKLRGNRFLGIRKVYLLRRGKIGSYSRDDLMIAHFSACGSRPATVQHFDDGVESDVAELGSIAEETKLQRRRIWVSLPGGWRG